LILEEYPALPRDWFERDARYLARALVGAFVVHTGTSAASPRRGQLSGRRRPRVARIVETEAYRGPDDGASHARFGLTGRTRTLLGPPGHAYVFLVYGMHECFNVVCLREGSGHAVLIRAGEPVLGLAEGDEGNGPGKLARIMGISRAHDGADLTRPPLYISPRQGKVRVEVSARVGVGYAGAVAEKKWRFFDRDSRQVSRPPASAIGLGR
jgi:DNA-3-methyladenine glycosylase